MLASVQLPCASIGGAFLLGAGAVVVLLAGAFVVGIVKGAAELPGKRRTQRTGARRAEFVQSLDPQQLAVVPRRTKPASDLQSGDVLHYLGGVHVIERIEPLPGGFVGVHAFDGPVSGIPPGRQVEVARERVAIPNFAE
jgi:hypothetical protein